MARRGTVKRFSVDHEDFIAKCYGGRRSRSSGAADNDAGDVRTSEFLIECKTVVPNVEKPKRPAFANQMEKITEEAWVEGRVPILAIRYFDPDSILADRDGWVDLVVKRVVDDSP